MRSRRNSDDEASYNQILLVAVGLILITAGVALGWTERIVIERHSWDADRFFTIAPGSHLQVQFNGARTYTYWRSIWEPEARSTWTNDHSFSWTANVVQGGHVLFLVSHEQAYKDRPSPVNYIHTDSTKPAWHWPIGDQGDQYILLINNGTNSVAADVRVGESWPQFKNQNVQDGLNLMIIGFFGAVVGCASWAWRQRRKKLPQEASPSS